MKTTFAILVIAGVSMFAACPSDASAQEWKKHHYLVDNFEVEFSGPVQVTAQSIGARQKVVRSTLYLQDSGSYAYSVGAQLNSSGVGVDLGPAAAGSFAVYGCKKVDDRELAFAGARAKELNGDQCLGGTFRARARHFAKNDWYYTVTYLVKIDEGDTSAADRFLQSFKIGQN